MKKIFILSIFFFISAIPGAAQDTPVLNQSNLNQQLDILFKQARQNQRVQQDAQAISQAYSQTAASVNVQQFAGQLSNPQFDQLIKRFSKQPQQVKPFTNKPQQPASQPKASAEKPWQLALFVAATEQERIPNALSALRGQIAKGTLSHAVVLDITPPSHDEDAVRKTARLYFVYKAGNKASTKTFALDTDVTSDDLLNSLFQHLKTTDNSLYTGLVFSNHGSGMEMFYNDTYFDIPELISSLNQQELHVDVIELDSCHMSSLYTSYHLAKNAQVDYLAGSSNYEYGTPYNTRVFPLISFLNESPKVAVYKSVNRRSKQFDFWSGEYETTGYSALDMGPLQEPLQEWFKFYGFLVLSSPQIGEAFNNFFKKDGEWRSLNKLVRKQRDYIISHFEFLESDYADHARFSEMKRDFINACNTLLEATQQATLTQWCYSATYDTLYRDKIPNNDCLESISADRTQFEELLKEYDFDLKKELSRYADYYRFRRF